MRKIKREMKTDAEVRPIDKQLFEDQNHMCACSCATAWERNSKWTFVAIKMKLVPSFLSVSTSMLTPQYQCNQLKRIFFRCLLVLTFSRAQLVSTQSNTIFNILQQYAVGIWLCQRKYENNNILSEGKKTKTNEDDNRPTHMSLNRKIVVSGFWWMLSSRWMSCHSRHTIFICEKRTCFLSSSATGIRGMVNERTKCDGKWNSSKRRAAMKRNLRLIARKHSRHLIFSCCQEVTHQTDWIHFLFRLVLRLTLFLKYEYEKKSNHDTTSSNVKIIQLKIFAIACQLIVFSNAAEIKSKDRNFDFVSFGIFPETIDLFTFHLFYSHSNFRELSTDK